MAKNSGAARRKPRRSATRKAAPPLAALPGDDAIYREGYEAYAGEDMNCPHSNAPERARWFAGFYAARDAAKAARKAVARA